MNAKYLRALLTPYDTYQESVCEFTWVYSNGFSFIRNCIYALLSCRKDPWTKIWIRNRRIGIITVKNTPILRPFFLPALEKAVKVIQKNALSPRTLVLIPSKQTAYETYLDIWAFEETDPIAQFFHKSVPFSALHLQRILEQLSRFSPQWSQSYRILGVDIADALMCDVPYESVQSEKNPPSPKSPLFIFGSIPFFYYIRKISMGVIGCGILINIGGYAYVQISLARLMHSFTQSSNLPYSPPSLPDFHPVKDTIHLIRPLMTQLVEKITIQKERMHIKVYLHFKTNTDLDKIMHSLKSTKNWTEVSISTHNPNHSKIDLATPISPYLILVRPIPNKFPA